jgi:Protein of unknown function (DUF1573)
MKKYYFIFCVVLIACSNDDSKRTKIVDKAMKDTANFTSIKWLDTFYSLGTISSGDIKELTFRCVNTGTKPLLLGNVTAGCGCTIASYSKQEIMPNKEGWVMAKFDSKKQCDSVTKSIYVTSNAKNDSLRTLTFKAHIINCQSNDKVVIPHDVKED